MKEGVTVKVPVGTIIGKQRRWGGSIYARAVNQNAQARAVTGPTYGSYTAIRFTHFESEWLYVFTSALEEE